MNLTRKTKNLSLRSACGNEKGIVLAVVLMFLAILAAMGSSAVVMTRADIKVSGNYNHNMQSFYTAESGLQRAVGSLNTTTTWIDGLTDTSDAFTGDNSFGNGYYVVEVFPDDPTFPSVRIRSTGDVPATSSLSTVEAVATPEFFPILDFATFSCGNLILKDGVDNLIDGGDVFVSGNIDLSASGTHRIQNGNVLSLGNININGTSSITGGNAFANGNMDLLSSNVPNIGGDATAGSNVSGGGTVSGQTWANTSPLPVTNYCLGTELANIAITSDVMQLYRDNATTTISGNYTVPDGAVVTYTGIVHITQNFTLMGNAVFTGNVIFVVDGNADIVGPGSLTSNPPGFSASFLVPTGNWEVTGGGSVTIDGIVHVGTVNPDGSNISGGDIYIRDNANLTINGSVVSANGNTDAGSGGVLTVNYQATNDINLTRPGSFNLTSWREVNN